MILAGVLQVGALDVDSQHQLRMIAPGRPMVQETGKGI